MVKVKAVERSIDRVDNRADICAGGGCVEGIRGVKDGSIDRYKIGTAADNRAVICRRVVK